MRPLYRPDPVLPVQTMQTYAIVSKPGLHTRRATCSEVECGAQKRGWRTTIDVNTPLGAKQANYIRLMSGRSFNSHEATGLVVFDFPAGQTCFADHQVPLNREPFYIKRGGDWRGVTSEPVNMRATDWVDDFANHQQNIADFKERG